MKKHLTLAALLVAALGLKAQQGEIIYRDFEPDSCITDQYSKLWIDFDNNGNGDVFLRMPHTSTGYWPEIVAQDNWEISWLENAGCDTIPNLAHWGQTYLWLDTEDQSRFAARRQIENDYYLYVWFEAYNYVTFNPFVCHLCFDKYAYCTIPNYPLVWGQTELMDIEETTESVPFAVIHPNPTNGMVTVTGESLRQAKVVNMLGQQVLSVQGHGNELQINMAALPAGVYVVNITNEKGQNCVKKVVRE